jgi:hypothetical protein
MWDSGSTEYANQSNRAVDRCRWARVRHVPDVPPADDIEGVDLSRISGFDRALLKRRPAAGDCSEEARNLPAAP